MASIGPPIPEETESTLLPAEPTYEGPLAHETINKEAKALYDAMDPETLGREARAHSILPVFYKDIDRIPEISKAMTKGIVEGATAGMVRLPDLKDETTPMFMFRTMGYMLGAAAPLSAANKLLAGTRFVATRVSRAALGSAVVGTQSGLESGGDPKAILLGAALGTLNALAGPKAIAKRRAYIQSKEAFVPTGGGAIAPEGTHFVSKTRLRGDVIQQAQLEEEAAFAERLIKDKLRPGTEEYVARWRREFNYDVQDPELLEVVEGLAKRSREGENFGGNMASATEDVAAVMRSPNGLAAKQADTLDDIEGLTLEGDPEEMIEEATRKLRSAPETATRQRTEVKPPGTEPPLLHEKPTKKSADTLTQAPEAPIAEEAIVYPRSTRRSASTGKRERIIVTPSGEALTESEALARRGPPSRRKSIDDIDVVREDIDPNTAKFTYYDKGTKTEVGSSTWARLTRVKGGAADPSGRVIPVRVGDDPEFMITSIQGAPGYNDAIIIDLRGRGARFVKPEKPTTAGIATRFGGRRVKDADDIIEFAPIPRGGAPSDPLEQFNKLSAAQGRKHLRASSWRPPKFVFDDLEQATGIPLYSRLFKGVEHVRNLARVEGVGLGNAIADAFGLARRAARISMLDDMIAGTPIQNTKLRHIIDKAINPMFKDWIGTTFDDYVTNIIPAIRKTKNSASIAHMLPGSKLDNLIRHVDSGRINLEEKDLARMLNQHLHAALFDIHMSGTYRAANKLIMSPNFPKELRDYTQRYLRGAEGSESRFVHTMGPIYQRIWKALGRDVLESESRQLIQTTSTLLHLGLLGFKPGPIIRNLLGGIQTGSRIGSKWVYEGSRQRFTAEGIALFKASGIPKEATVLTDALNDMAASPVTRGLNTVTKFSLGPYSSADMIPRAQMYLGGRSKFLAGVENLPLSVSDDVLFTKTGLWRMHPIARREVSKVWRAGNTEGAARLFGMHAQQDTQWVYRSGSKPLALQSDMGKALGTFGIWPMNFVEYMRQMATLPMPAIERAKWIAEYTAMNGAIVGAFTGLGASLGMGVEAFWHTVGWTGAGSMMYGGGPLLEAIPATAHAAHELLKGQPGQGVREFKHSLLAATPFSGAASTIQRARGKTLTGTPSTKYAKPKSTAEMLFRGLTDIQREK